MAWIELLAQSPLRPGSQNLFAALARETVTHLRLNIFPDGGVARFRAFGQVRSAWEPAELDAETTARVSPGHFDMASLKNGGTTLACSDAFFGPMNNLLLPGRAADMGGGWETRRKRGPGHDWILVRLGARGAIRCVEVDTRHFLGNCPDRCSIEWIDSARGADHRPRPERRLGDVAGRDEPPAAYPTLLRRRPDRAVRARHSPPSQHLSGRRCQSPARMGHSTMTDVHRILNAAPRDEAAALLERCCGFRRWVEEMLDRRPFASRAALENAADEVWARMTRDDYLEAFRHHPRIGSGTKPAADRHEATADWSREEQSVASRADAATTQALREANAAYEERFGFVFLVCATGRSATEILRSLEGRLQNDPETELSVAAGEQAKITRLRLEKLAR